MELIQRLVPESKYSTKCPYYMKPKFIIIHNTGNDADAEDEITYMTNNNLEVSYHIAVDDKQAIQGIPFARNAWANGDGGSGLGNRNGISIEICYSKSGGERFNKAEKNCAILVAKMLKERGWGIDKVKKHQDFSGKYCPHRTLDLGWQRFLNMVQVELNILNNQNVKEVKKVKGIVVYSNDIDRRAAEYLADYLKLPTINSGTSFDYTTVEQSGIYAVGGKRDTYTSYLLEKNFISGSDRYNTVIEVLRYIGKL